MMMTRYPTGPDRFARPRPKRWRRFIALIAAAAFLVWGGSWLADRLSPAATVVEPLAKTAGQATLGGLDFLSALLGGKDRLLAQNQALQTKVAELEVRLLDYDQVRAERATLLGQLGFKASSTEALTIGRVLSLGWASPYDTLIAEIPTGQLVRVGAPVTFGGSLLLGLVGEVNDNLVRIRLLSAPGSETPVLVGTSTAAVKARGRGNGNFEVTLPRGVPVMVGDVVTASSSPAERYLGRIGEIESDPSDSSQKIFFRFPLNIGALRFVEIHDF